jgi:hypothetical protein
MSMIVAVQEVKVRMWEEDPSSTGPHSSYPNFMRQIAALPPPRGYKNLCGVLLATCAPPMATPATPLAHRAAGFVRTLATAAALHAAALALGAARGVLVAGPPSAGKSSLISELARQAGQEEGMLKLYMDAQADAKALLGAYVCAATPGEYRWQAGPLTNVRSAALRSRGGVADDRSGAVHESSCLQRTHRQIMGISLS